MLMRLSCPSPLTYHKSTDYCIGTEPSLACAVFFESMDKLSGLTDSVKLEGFAGPQQSASEKKEKASSKFWLRNLLRRNVSF
jgi:hypothetical protein